MTEFFQTTYYGNTIGEWRLAFSLILASVIMSRILFRIFSRGFRFLTRKTRTDLDDIIIDQIEEPIIAAILIFGIRLSINTLTISESSETWLGGAINFSLTLVVAWLISRLYNALHEQYLVPLSVKTQTDVDDLLLPMLNSGIKIIVWTLAIIVGAVLAGLGLGGLAFALAAQDVIANFLGGITIFVQRPFTIGDEIIILDPSRKRISGYIRKIGIRTTLLEGKHGSKFTVPNRTFSEHSIEKIEYSRTKFRMKNPAASGAVFWLFPHKFTNNLSSKRKTNRTMPLTQDFFPPGFFPTHQSNFIHHCFSSYYFVDNLPTITLQVIQQILWPPLILHRSLAGTV